MIANKRVAVPSYQRLYAWSDDQVNDLFRDLADAIRKPDSEYFLGTLVYANGVERGCSSHHRWPATADNR